MARKPVNTLNCHAATQEEFNQATPTETSLVKDNPQPTTVDQPVPSSPARFSCSGRQIRKPEWTKDYVMDEGLWYDN